LATVPKLSHPQHRHPGDDDPDKVDRKLPNHQLYDLDLTQGNQPQPTLSHDATF
jgi:hypothetical protein